MWGGFERSPFDRLKTNLTLRATRDFKTSIFRPIRTYDYVQAAGGRQFMEKGVSHVKK
jgi:hypothetical protein